MLMQHQSKYNQRIVLAICKYFYLQTKTSFVGWHSDVIRFYYIPQIQNMQQKNIIKNLWENIPDEKINFSPWMCK